MRVTNNMIMDNASSNINSTKELVNTRNTQMTTQKKISKPSEDPVIAVRSLRLSTTLSQVDQYYAKNIPDATSWMDVTETALINMRSITSDCRTLSVTGSTDTYSEKDRKTLINQLESLQEQLYAEGNASYAGRTVFTGFRTDCNLTFTEDETETKYRINQTIDVDGNMEEYRYYSGNVDIPTAESELTNEISDITENEYYRIRLNYDDVDSLNSLKFTYTDKDGNTVTQNFDFEAYRVKSTDDPTEDSYLNETSTAAAPIPITGTVEAVDSSGTAATTDQTAYTLHVYANEDDWAAADPDATHTTDASKIKTVGDDEVVFIESTGEIIFGKNVSTSLMKNDATVDVQYDKTGFDSGELRPEYYYNCTKFKDPDDVNIPVTYTKFDEDGDVKNFDIQYTVAQDQTLTVNTEASNVFDSSLQRDLGEMINAVQATIDAHTKVDTLTAMKEETQYASDEDQELLDKWIDAATKEANYADDNMQKLFSTELGKIDTYYAKINLAITDLGCKGDSLSLTKTRMGDQQETVEDLQSQNDDVDLSQIIIDYTAAYTAYQASLTAASKLGSSTLLNYI